MQILFEFFVLRADPELSARLAETLRRDPAAATAALVLLREDRQIDLVSAPTVLALAGEPASFRSAYREVAFSIEAVGEVQDTSVEIELHLVLDEEDSHIDQRAQLLAADEGYTVLDVPDLFVAVRPAIVSGADEAREILEARDAQRDQRLEELGVRGERSRRHAVEALLTYRP
jgi:type II secretory pathway component GspD/PulD (secretin)